MATVTADTVLCNYCDCDDATVVFEAGAAQVNCIVRCNCCGLMYANPRARVPDPLDTLCAIHRVLKPGGVLVMETPRYDSLMFRLLGRRERSVSCDGHIYFFTTDSLQKLYGKAGFTTVARKYVGRSLNLERLTWNVGVMSKSRTVQKALDTISNRFRFNNVKLYMNMRDMQRVYVRKG